MLVVITMVERIIRALPEKRLDKIFEKSVQKAAQKNKDIDQSTSLAEWKKLSVEEKRAKCLQAWNVAKKKDPGKATYADKAMEAKVTQEVKRVTKDDKLSESVEFLDENFKEVLEFVFMGVGIFTSLLAFLLGISHFWMALAAIGLSAVSSTISRAIARSNERDVVNEMNRIDEYFYQKYNISLNENLINAIWNG